MKLSHDLKKLGDFTTTARVLPIAGLAMVIGLIGAFVALVVQIIHIKHLMNVTML